MNLLKTTSLLISVLFLSLDVTAKDRYLVVYKSTQGFSAMNTFMRLESSKGWGLKKALHYIKGMVLQISDEQAVKRLQTHPEVLVVEKEKFYPAPRPVRGFISQALQVTTTKTQARASLLENKVASFRAEESTPWGVLSIKAPEAWIASPDEGAQARVLMLDSGLDIHHTAIKDNFEKGRNFMGEDSSVIDEDITDNMGHGTHTSGTVAGEYNPQTGFVGVAPQAKILMGKVCEDDGCSSIAIADGINWGIQEKVDLISLSLGGPFSTTTLGEYYAVQAAEAAGVLVVAASGNGVVYEEDGSITNPGVNYPAAYPTTLAVGAVDSHLTKALFSNWGPELDITGPGVEVLSSVPTGTGRELSVDLVIAGQKTHLKSAAFLAAADTLQLVYGSLISAGLGKAEDFLGQNFTGKLALISRGEISFSEKVQNAMAAGAVGAVIYNNEAGLLTEATLSEDPTLPPVEFPVAMIEQADGQNILNQLNAGILIDTEIVTLIKDYMVWDGTSMATPHVTGAAALVISAYKNSHPGKNITPRAVREILKQTSIALGPNSENEYGAGLVQAEAAVKAAKAAP